MHNNVEHDSKLVIGHALYDPWKTILKEGQLFTWLENQGADIHHAYGRPISKYIRKIDVKYWDMKWMKLIGKSVMLVERSLKWPLSKIHLKIREVPGFKPKTINWEIQTPDLNVLLGNKTIAIFEHFLSTNKNYLIMTTSSSYINLDNVNNHLGSHQKTNVVAGRIITQRDTKFASGSFRILSRDVVTAVINNRSKYDYWLPEDLALVRLLRAMDIDYVEIPSIDLTDVHELRKLTKDDLWNFTHFRLKSGTFNNRHDVELMKELHRKLWEK